MSDLFTVPDRVRLESHVSSQEEYSRLYDLSVTDPAKFWGKIADEFVWETRPSLDNFVEYNFDVDKGDIYIRWMKDGKTNICYNCLDRHVQNTPDRVAFYWEGNEIGDERSITYAELLKQVCQFANVLKAQGVKKGDRVAIYMPMVLELIVAMLACARIGAIHSIVFGGYSADSLSSRLVDGDVSLLITADGAWRGQKVIHLMETANHAMISAEKTNKMSSKIKCIVLKHLPEVRLPKGCSKPDYEHLVTQQWNDSRDQWWHDLTKDASDKCDVEWMNSEDPLFMLYTSGSTGLPKGVVHTISGYMLYTATTFKYVFDHQVSKDVYWCTADIGWITGHSYVTYGPLLNGATSVVFEGTPFYPSPERVWQVIDKYAVSKFYTAPTAIRALMKFGDDLVKKNKLDSLKVVGSVGEPINPEAWLWYHTVVGKGQCAVVDTYWQTETGGHVLTPLPGSTAPKPGSACQPFFGVCPVILDESGKEIEGEAEGYIAFKRPWPGIMRTVYNNHHRFQNTYFKKFPGYYLSGDGGHRDKDGYLWITGRIDDMLNCSGHLMSTAQVESVLVEHPAVAEAAVVAKTHLVKGECLYCFVTPNQGVSIDTVMHKELVELVRERIAHFATPDFIQEAPHLPKTRSGKIMRRILRKIANGESDLGDTSTLADESVIKELRENRDRVVKK